MDDPLVLGKLPRMAERADDPGAYQPAVRVRNPVIDPGDIVEMEVFFTGYGNILDSKLVIYPSLDVFDSTQSKIIHDLKIDGQSMAFGGVESTLSEHGVMIVLRGGMKLDGWPDATMYFDVESPIPVLASEEKMIDAPVHLKLKTIDSVRPGNYQVQYFFTYNDGSRWNTTVVSSSFMVRNLLQRHEVLIATIATVAAAVTIAPAVPYLLRIAYCVVQVLRWIHWP